jgi:Family of unknown function (DUF6433)
MQLGIAEILEKISNQSDFNIRKQMLANQAKNQALITILRFAFDPLIKTNLPEGDPPYKPCQYQDQQAMLYNSMRKMYLFFGDGNPAIPKAKKEAIFVNMLESLDPADAVLLLAVKDKKMPYPGITEDLVREVFPGLLPPKPITTPEPSSVKEEVKPSTKKKVIKPKVEA